MANPAPKRYKLYPPDGSYRDVGTAQHLLTGARSRIATEITKARKKFAVRVRGFRTRIRIDAKREAAEEARRALASRFLEVEQIKGEQFRSFSQKTQQIILALTEELTGSTFEYCPELIVEKIHLALTAVRTGSGCTLRINPIHAAAVALVFPAPNYSVEPDSSMAPGAIGIVTPHGSVELDWRKDLPLIADRLKDAVGASSESAK